MDELIQGLVAVLERGIVVEPYGENWPYGSVKQGAIRIRLADEPATTVVTNDAMKERLNW